MLFRSISSAIFYGTPLFYAALGGILTERSGVLNLGVEGTMLVGGVTAAWTCLHVGGSAWFVITASILVGALAGGLVSTLLAFLCITLKTNQTVAGLAITIFAGTVGLSSYFANIWEVAKKPVPHPIRTMDVFGLADTPVLGPILFRHTSLTYVSWLLAIIATIYLFRTRIGLQLRAVGESPQTEIGRAHVCSSHEWISRMPSSA